MSEKFWELPAEVNRVLAAGVKASEALSKKHRRHPAVGYKNIAPVNRPTYEGSSAQKHQRGKNVEEQGDIESSSEGDSEDDSADE